MSHHEKKSKGMGRTFLLILIGFFLIGFVTNRVIQRFSAEHPTYDQARAVERAKKLEELRAKEKAQLETYGVVDAAKGIYRIPIAQAETLELERLRQKTVKPAGVIPVPEVKK